jgi:2-oxoglutarate dehydrogenase E2 component (dihydrolipoamide succinyltransferase)
MCLSDFRHAKSEEPIADEKKDEPKPDAKPEEPTAEEKKDEPKPDAKPEEPKTVPALPNVPHALALETPRSYVDPVPVLKTVTWPLVSSAHPIRNTW